MNHSRHQTWMHGILLVLIILLGAYLRLANLRTNPAWYPDEGSYLNIAWNLWQGNMQSFSVGGTLLLNARAPLFPSLLTHLFPLFGYDILVARVATALAGIATIPLLYLALRSSLGRGQALATAAFFAIFPIAVIWNRWAFDYNLLMPLFVLCFWSLWCWIETRQARWMVMAACCTAVAILTAWVAVSLVVCLGIVGWLYHRRLLLWALPLAVSLPTLYLGSAYLAAPNFFIDDFALTFTRSNSSPLAQFVFAAFNYALFIASNYWLIPGIIGLFLIERRRVRALVLLIFFVTLFSVLRFSSITELGFHRVLALVPFLALGVVMFLWRAIPGIARLVIDDLDWLGHQLGLHHLPRGIFVLKLVGVPLIVYFTIAGVLVAAILSDGLSVATQFATRIDKVLATPPRDAMAAIDYVNTHAHPDDVVIASPQIGWALTARAVDFQQTLSYAGYPTDNYPTPIDQARFVFDPSPANARFAVVDRMWTVWAVENITSTKILLNELDQWHIAFRAGDFVVRENPNRK